MINGQEVAYLTSEELANLEDFQAEAIANTQALEERVRAWNDLMSYTDHLYQVYEYTESARQSEAWSCRAISAGLFSLGILVGL